MFFGFSVFSELKVENSIILTFKVIFPSQKSAESFLLKKKVTFLLTLLKKLFSKPQISSKKKALGNKHDREVIIAFI